MKLFQLGSCNYGQLSEETAGILADGGIAIVPTDTVYGIICDGLNQSAKEKVFLMKGRPSEKPLIGFVDSMDKASRFAHIPRNTAPFVRQRWPGAATFLFRATENLPGMTSGSGKMAFRIPRHDFISGICRKFDIIASTSANISGRCDACCTMEIPGNLKELADIVICGGRVKGRPSAIWDATVSPPCLLRGNVLFACEGNSCRSPMAEFLLKERLKGTGSMIKVESGGTGILNCASASPYTYQVMKEKGIDIHGFLSRPVTTFILGNSDLIFAMEEKHREAILSVMPEYSDRIEVLGLRDPAGRDIDTYRRTREKLEILIDKIVIPRICLK